MVVEIEKGSVSFTDEAQVSLQRVLLRLERRIRAKAADQAIKSHGTPAEVTGSDVERAYRELSQPDSIDSFQRLVSERKFRRSHMVRLISKAYIFVGLVTALAGGFYPYIHDRLANPTFRLSAVITLSGLGLSGLGFFLGEYMRQRELALKDDAIRHYSQFFLSRRESK
jgi:hypothetical protein